MVIIMGKGCIEAIYGLMGWKGILVISMQISLVIDLSPPPSTGPPSVTLLSTPAAPDYRSGSPWRYTYLTILYYGQPIPTPALALPSKPCESLGGESNNRGKNANGP